MTTSTNPDNAVINYVCKGPATIGTILKEEQRECFILVMPNDCDYDVVKVPKYISEHLAKTLPVMMNYYKKNDECEVM